MYRLNFYFKHNLPVKLLGYGLGTAENEDDAPPKGVIPDGPPNGVTE